MPASSSLGAPSEGSPLPFQFRVACVLGLTTARASSAGSNAATHVPVGRVGRRRGVGSGMSRWGILALVTASHGLGALSVLAVAPLAPFLLDALHLSRAQVGWFLPAVYLGGVLMALPAGWL